jgi:hypothetical protein
MNDFDSFVNEQKETIMDKHIDKEEFLQYKENIVKKMAKLQYENMILSSELARFADVLKMFEHGYNIMDEKLHNTNLLIRKLYKKIK